MNHFLQNISVKSAQLFFIILFLISVIAFHLALPLIWMLFALVTVLFFFINSNKLCQKWLIFTDLQFGKKLFATALIIRLIWVIFSYYFYQYMNGNPFEFSAADAPGYHNEVKWMIDVLSTGNWDIFWQYYTTRLSDMGYPVYLIMIYTVFGKSILLVRLIKALISALTVILVYKIARRNFDETVGRIAGILAMLYPNLIYYTGLHVKETEMVFLLVAFVERADFLLRQKKLKTSVLLLVLTLGVSLYFFRAVLAYSAFVSVTLMLIFSREEIFRLKKSMILVLGLILLVLFLYGNAYFSEAAEYWSNRFSNQEVSLGHRAQTNAFARYGSTFVFAPIVLMAPFPTLVNIETQQNHMLLSGAYYVKNIMAFFVVVAIITLLMNKEWKNHVLILSVMVSYTSILTMSKFALVERFHMPALPFHILFTAYGISKVNNKNMRFFPYYLFGIALIILGWNWFKLAGRGLV